MKQANCGYEDGVGVYGRDLLVRGGPTLIVNIGFDPAYDLNKPSRLPNLPGKGLQALIDTGATDCCIDSDLAMQLQLPIIDQGICNGISGPMPVNVHLAQIHAPDLSFTLVGRFAGVQLASGQRHAVLIGRTFLRHFHMTYEGETGRVILVDGY